MRNQDENFLSSEQRDDVYPWYNVKQHAWLMNNCVSLVEMQQARANLEHDKSFCEDILEYKRTLNRVLETKGSNEKRVKELRGRMREITAEYDKKCALRFKIRSAEEVYDADQEIGFTNGFFSTTTELVDESEGLNEPFKCKYFGVTSDFLNCKEVIAQSEDECEKRDTEGGQSVDLTNPDFGVTDMFDC